jgi:hypothetical protein
MLAPIGFAGCDSHEDASTSAEAETVEVAAEQALEGVSAMPVADPDARTDVADDGLVEEAEPGGTPPAGAPPILATQPDVPALPDEDEGEGEDEAEE